MATLVENLLDFVMMMPGITDPEIDDMLHGNGLLPEPAAQEAGLLSMSIRVVVTLLTQNPGIDERVSAIAELQSC